MPCIIYAIDADLTIEQPVTEKVVPAPAGTETEQERSTVTGTQKVVPSTPNTEKVIP